MRLTERCLALSSKNTPQNARFLLAFFLCAFFSVQCCAQQMTIELVDGMILGPGNESSVQYIVPPKASVASQEQVKVSLIRVLDDGLRRTYMSVNRCGEPRQTNGFPPLIKIPQQEANVDLQVPPGPITYCTPFNVFGRRICILRGGVIKIVQGISEVSSNYIKVVGLNGEKGEYQWDMRLSPYSLDGKTLRDILVQNANPKNPNEWLEIVNLFRAAKRYDWAREVLVEGILKFPELERNKADLKSLDQDITDQMFSAADRAQSAGQYMFSKLVLEGIKKGGLSIETQLKVAAKLESLESNQRDQDELINWMTEDISKLNEGAVKVDLQSLLPEIAANLTADTAVRFTDYRRRRSDATLKPDQLAAIAISGWIFGPAAGKDNISVVASGIKARRIIQQYLSKPVRDDQLIQELSKLESNTPELVAKILANMAPPLATPETAAVLYTEPAIDNSQQPNQVKIPGRYTIEVPLGGAMAKTSSRYTVQLPPEYNPYRRYPCVFTLPSELTNTEWQIAWWAGQYSPENKRCFGEASNRGYIVVSPDWALPKQPSYNYTENEHAMILAPLRDAFKRFSIDTDKVFLSGHFMGADAAWDIALAHPDLWAGNIVISGEAQKYVVQYWNNALYVPGYFVSGELDSFTETNGKEWDKLMKQKQIDSLVTLYRGRKADHFLEELPRIMDWMSFPARTRNPFPKDFAVTTLRAGDRFFWWFETEDLFTDKLISPLLYRFTKPGSGYQIKSSVNKETNSIFFETVPADNFTIWLSPEMVDFEKQITVIKGGRTRIDPKPETRVILEDARGRADRQHPFWMRYDSNKKPSSK